MLASARPLHQTATSGKGETHHDVLWLQQSPHNIQHCSLPDTAADWPSFTVNSQRRVARLQEVATGCGDQGGNQPHQIVVHVAWTPAAAVTAADETIGKHGESYVQMPMFIQVCKPLLSSACNAGLAGQKTRPLLSVPAGMLEAVVVGLTCGVCFGDAGINQYSRQVQTHLDISVLLWRQP